MVDPIVSEVVDVVVDPFTQEKLPLRLPLTSDTEADAAAKGLGLPAYVDASDPVIARAVGVFHALSNELPGRPLAFLGGVAFRLRSPASNSPTSGLRRPLHDIDLCCHHVDSRKLLTAFTGLGDRYGSALTVVETHADRQFNALMGGRRLRLHYVVRVVDRQATLGTIDVLADEFRFCHSLDLTPDIERAPRNGHTLGLSTLLLTKLQYIQSIPSEDAVHVPGRVLGPFGKKEVLIGPEEKDVQDILAVLVDHPIGEGVEDVSAAQFVRPLASEWGYWTTVRLNLGHLLNTPTFNRLAANTAAAIRKGVGALQTATDTVRPARRLGFLRREWWEPVESPESPGGGLAPS